MDVLGAVASTVQLLNQAIHTIQSIRNVPTRIRVQGQILKELLIISEEIQRNQLLRVESIRSILEELSGTIKSIQERLPSSRTGGKRILRHWQSVKYYFKEDDVLALMQSLEPAKTSLLICIANEQVNSAGRSSDNIEDVKMKVNCIQKTLFEASTAPLDVPTTPTSPISPPSPTTPLSPTSGTTLLTSNPSSPLGSSFPQSFAPLSLRQAPRASTWTAKDSVPILPSSRSTYADISASGSAQQMNGDIIWGYAGPAQESRNVYSGIVAGGESRQMNGSIYRPYPSGEGNEKGRGERTGLGWPLDEPS